MVKPRLVCFGNLTIDDVVLPDGREQPGCIGGDALYAVLAARLWEPTAEMVAPIGADFPDAVLARIAAAGLSRDGLPARALPTLRNRVVYAADGSRTWTLYAMEDEFDALSPRTEDIPAAFRAADAVLVLAMTLSAQENLVTHFKGGAGPLVLLDPQEDYIAGNEPALRRLIARADVFLPSAEEVRRLLGHGDWAAAARTFAELGPAIVVIKLGEEGCLVYERARDRLTSVPAIPTGVLDTTGAGDCFCGAFAAALLQNPGDPVAAARAGTVAASFAVEGYGAEPMFAVSTDAARARLRATAGS